MGRASEKEDQVFGVTIHHTNCLKVDFDVVTVDT